MDLLIYGKQEMNRRSVIETVGLFNEELIRTEDNEYHYTVICMLGFSWPTVCLWIAYCIANVGMTVIACITSKIGSTNSIVLPIIFLLLHICYGVGTMFGIFVCLVSRIIEGGGYSEEVNSFFEMVAPCPVWTGVAA